MDFIEQWFGISPDGGNGSLEALYIIAITLVVAALIVGFRRRVQRLFLWYLEQLGKREP